MEDIHYTGNYYADYSDEPENWMRPGAMIRYRLKWVLFVFLFLLLFLVPAALTMGKAGPNSPDYDRLIRNVLEKTNRVVYDVNKDGKVSCVDYAVTFKNVWDEAYPYLRYKCLIVRNNNPSTGMNHLFVHVWDDDNRSIDVEPNYGNQRYGSYDMKASWGYKYNDKYNYYGETDYWLDQGGRK